MKRHWTLTLIASLALSLAACSSSPKEEGEAEELAATEAGTDAVPTEGGEQAAAPAEGDVPPQADTPPPAEGEAAPSPPADSASAAPTPSPSFQGSGQFEEYSVQGGDTLMKIAFETYGDIYQWRAIYEANKDKISNPNVVPKGTVLKLEKPSSPVTIERNGEKFLIRQGDTLGTISDEVYGTKTKWKKLWENNKQLIKDPNRIFAGFYLYYSMTPEEKQEAEQLKQNRAPAPVAGGAQGGTDTARAPAATDGGGAPATTTQ
jgi:nucleoid-associated protein YgaU